MNHLSSRVFVVIPAFNEQGALRNTLGPLIPTGYQIVVVDDGSTDGTWQVINGLPVHALRHPVNLGQGAALQTGVKYAVASNAEFIVHFDADGQHRVEDIDVLLAPLRADEADIILGSRFLRADDVRSIPPLRRLLLRAARIVNFAFTGLWLTDAHNGFRAMTSAAASKIELQENGFAHATEVLSLIRRHGLRYLERPTHIQYTAYSQAKGQRFSSAFNILLDLLLGRVFR